MTKYVNVEFQEEPSGKYLLSGIFEEVCREEFTAMVLGNIPAALGCNLICEGKMYRHLESRGWKHNPCKIVLIRSVEGYPSEGSRVPRVLGEI